MSTIWLMTNKTQLTLNFQSTLYILGFALMEQSKYTSSPSLRFSGFNEAPSCKDAVGGSGNKNTNIIKILKVIYSVSYFKYFNDTSTIQNTIFILSKYQYEICLHCFIQKNKQKNEIFVETFIKRTKQ